MKKALIVACCAGACVSVSVDVAGQLPALPVQPTAQVELGRLLFWDPILSGDRDVACAFDRTIPDRVPSGLPPGGR